MNTFVWLFMCSAMHSVRFFISSIESVQAWKRMTAFWRRKKKQQMNEWIETQNWTQFVYSTHEYAQINEAHTKDSHFMNALCSIGVHIFEFFSANNLWIFGWYRWECVNRRLCGKDSTTFSKECSVCFQTINWIYRLMLNSKIEQFLASKS